jgi:hypothetical protein
VKVKINFPRKRSRAYEPVLGLLQHLNPTSTPKTFQLVTNLERRRSLDSLALLESTPVLDECQAGMLDGHH